MSSLANIAFWSTLHFICLVCNLEVYTFKLLPRPMNYLMPITWTLGLMFSAASLGTCPESFSVSMLAVFFLITFTCGNKLLLFYKRMELGLVCSLGVCTEGLILNVLIGMNSSSSGGLFSPMLFIACSFQLIYGYILHKKGTLTSKQGKDIDLGMNEGSILSDFIKE